MPTPEIHVVTDERLDLPSASAIESYFHCPGKLNLERVARESLAPPPVSKAASVGTLIHEADETGDASELDSAQYESLERIREMQERIIVRWKEDIEQRSRVHSTHAEDLADYQYLEHRERRYWGPGSTYSGKADLVIEARAGKNREFLLLDTKTGRKGVTPPPSNWQLRALAVAIWYELKRNGGGYCAIRVGIVAPWMKVQPLCDYTDADLHQATNILLDHLNEAKSPSAKRFAGSQCEFCIAKPICPEARDSMASVIALAARSWDSVKPESKKLLWQAAKRAIAVGESIKNQIKEDLNSGQEIPGLVKGKDSMTASVDNALEAYLNIKEHFPITPEAFIAQANIGVGALTEYVASVTGLSKAKSRLKVDQALGDVIILNPKSGAPKEVEEGGSAE